MKTKRRKKKREILLFFSFDEKKKKNRGKSMFRRSIKPEIVSLILSIMSPNANRLTVFKLTVSFPFASNGVHISWPALYGHRGEDPRVLYLSPFEFMMYWDAIRVETPHKSK